MSNLPTPIYTDLSRAYSNPRVSPVSGRRNGGAQFEESGKIKQTERLFSARPRSTPMAGSVGELYKKASSSRGSFAFIKLLTSSEQASTYKDGSARKGSANLTGEGSIVSSMVSEDTASGYDKFLLTRVSTSLREKVQVTPTFGDGEVVYYFGREPLIFDIAGTLIDSVDNSWFSDWLHMYSDFMRGTQLAKNYELLKIVLPNMILVGTIMNMNFDMNSENDVQIGFGFQFLAKEMIPLPAVPVNQASSSAANRINFSSATSFMSQKGINALSRGLSSVKSLAASLTDTIKNPLSTVSAIGKSLMNWSKGINSTLKDSFKKLTGGLGDSAAYKKLKEMAAMFRTESANLMGVRAQLFSPIYGVLNSLTKLVNNVFGAANSIFKSIMDPIRSVLRDITNISRQAIGLVNLVNNSIRGLGRNITSQIRGFKRDFQTARKTLGRAAGAIATAPTTVLQSISHMFQSGHLSGSAAFLSSNPRVSLSSSTLSSGSSSINSRSAILSRGVAQVSTQGASL